MKKNEVTQQEAETPVNLDLGKSIQDAREAKNLSQVDLADKLNLHVTTIEFLEAEQFDELPAPAFVRGYIRAIAIELALDVDKILHVYATHKQLDPNLGSTSAAEKQRKASDPSMVWVTVTILVLVVVLLGVWAVNSLSNKNAEPVNNIQETVSVLPEIALNLDPSLLVPESSIEAPVEGEALDLAPTAAIEVPNEVTPASIKPAAPQGDDSLTFTAKGPSWADIRDSSNFKLVYGLLDKNDGQQTVTGKAPFSVFLGDARQLELKFQGKTFNFSEHIRDNNVAKFSVE